MKRFIFLLLVSAAAIGFAQDRVVFKNGNHLDARVLSIGMTTITLKASIGELQVPRREIETIVFSGSMVTIGLASSEIVKGILSEDSALSVKVETITGPRVINRSDIASMEPVAKMSFDAIGRESADASPAAATGSVPLLRFFAVDKKGTPISGWRPTEIKFKLDEVETPVASVSAAVPGKITLVLDTSLSMKSWMKELTSGLDAFLHAVPPGTKVQILCFNDDVKLLESISNPSELVNKLEFKGGSLLYDAVAAAVGQATHDQEALLLITDGSDTGSAIVSSVALQKVEATDIPCYTIGIAAPPTGSKDSGNAIDKAFLEDLAKISGAAFVMKDPRKADKNPDLATVLKQIAAEMAATDSIQLVNGSAIAPGWHQIEIDVTRGGVKVHCKKQVFYGAK